MNLLFSENLSANYCIITKFLEDESIVVSKTGVAKFLKHYLATGSIVEGQGSRRKTKITEDVKRIIDQQMSMDDETTTTQLHILITNYGYCPTLYTILRC